MQLQGPWPTTVSLLRGITLVLACSRPCPSGKGLDLESEPLPTGCVALAMSLCPSELLPSHLQLKVLMVRPDRRTDRKSRVGTGARWLSRAPERQAPNLAGSGERLEGMPVSHCSSLWVPALWPDTGRPHSSLPCHLPCPGRKPGYSPWPQMARAAVVVRRVGGGLPCDGRWVERALQGPPTPGACDLSPSLV